MRHIAAIAIGVGMMAGVGCESDVGKAQRLREAQDIACFDANRLNGADQVAHDRDPDYKQTPQERQSAVVAISVELRAKCDAATSKFNAFMNR